MFIFDVFLPNTSPRDSRSAILSARIGSGARHRNSPAFVFSTKHRIFPIDRSLYSYLSHFLFRFVPSPLRAVVNRIENDGGSSRSRASLSNLLSSRFAGSKKMTSIRFQSKSKSKSRKKENKLDCGQRGLFVASTIMIIAFFCFLFLLYLLSLFFFLSLSKGEGGRRTDERPRRPRRRTLRRSSSCLVTPLHPPAPAISSRWLRMAGDRSRQKPRTSCDCRPRSQRRLRSRPRPDTRPSPSILPFSFISLLPSLPYPLLFHALFFVFEILLDSSVSFSSEKIFHDYSFFFFPLVRTTLDLFIRKIYIYICNNIYMYISIENDPGETALNSKKNENSTASIRSIINFSFP